VKRIPILFQGPEQPVVTTEEESLPKGMRGYEGESGMSRNLDIFQKIIPYVHVGCAAILVDILEVSLVEKK
jgi:hypothetical protein